jgi:hypothetical protein
MSISQTLLVIEIVLTVAEVLLGHHCWVFALEAILRLVALAWISAGEM